MTCFKYLGVVFQSSRKNTAHIKYASLIAQRSAAAIVRYHRTTGGNYIPAALKLFTAKPLAQLLYGAPFSINSKLDAYEKVQSGFLRSITLTPKCIPNAALRLEAGVQEVETKVWQSALQYWIRVKTSPNGLLPLINTDRFQSTWGQTIQKKLASYGLPVATTLSMGSERAKKIIRQRIADIDRQNTLTRLPSTYRQLYEHRPNHPAIYLKTLENPRHRWTFTRARFNALPSALLTGRYLRIPLEQRLCPCDLKEIESISHVLLYCTLYRDLRKELSEPL